MEKRLWDHRCGVPVWLPDDDCASWSSGQCPGGDAGHTGVTPAVLCGRVDELFVSASRWRLGGECHAALTGM